MKRVFAIAVCLSLFCGGAVWVLTGCESMTMELAGNVHGGTSSSHHQDDAQGSSSSHSDPGKIHCPNLFAAFLVGSRICHEPDRRVQALVNYPAVGLSLVHGLIASRFNLGPPGPMLSPQRSRHLLLSVIRI
ncbi:MAG: hypothetical protein EXR70_17755 [Deltaproteobacteria bacterium]|nr:hypothetical protein [Deltaproteobacteria bacterium]